MRQARSSGWLATAVFGLACAHAPSAVPSSRSLPPTAALQTEIAQNERLGQLIFLDDFFSARATDVLFDAKVLPNDARIRGWLTYPSERGWTVEFVTGDEPPTSVYEVTFDKSARFEPTPDEIKPARVLAGDHLAMWRARRTAMAAQFRACSDRYNTIILPGAVIGKRGWLVYLLAATVKPREAMLWGHHRFVVSDDGLRTERQEALSRGCGSHPWDEQTQALAVTQAEGSVPLETDVFASLLYRLDIYVRTDASGRVWKISHGRITAADETFDHRANPPPK